MLENVQHQINDVARKLNIDQKMVNDFLRPNKKHEFEIKLKNGKTFPAYRVQHNNKRGPYKGGIRFHPQVGLDEAQGLAALMSLKTTVLGLPLGGAKGGVAVDMKSLSNKELEELSRKYAAHLTPHIGPSKDIPAPDVGTDSQVIDWMVDEFQHLTSDKSGASFTGKSLSKGGSLGRVSATGLGGVIVLEEVLKQYGHEESNLKIAVQGLGNVGQNFILSAAKLHSNWQIVALSDSRSAVYNLDGLDAQRALDWKNSGQALSKYKNAQNTTNEKLLALKVDVLVLAALENAVNVDNMKSIKAGLILELANNPLSAEAQDYLTNKGKIVIPDIIANAGGVVVSYLEMYQNLHDLKYTEAEINQKLQNYMVDAVRRVGAYAKKSGLSLKDAAIGLALKELID